MEINFMPFFYRKYMSLKKFNEKTRTFDCNASLNDSEVLDFCRKGYLIFKNVVSDDVNKKTLDYLKGNIEINPIYVPDNLTIEILKEIRLSIEPSTILLEDWFIKNVLLNKFLIEALRSLLGANVGLPVMVSNHRIKGKNKEQGWHHDADCIYSPEINFLEVFYYPQDTLKEMGPTEIYPGSHIGPVNNPENKLNTYETVLLELPKGSFVIHHQSLLHRRAKSTSDKERFMLKFNFWRTENPKRDWIIENNFNFSSAYYGGHLTARYVAHMFYWLCGKVDQFKLIGGQAWPWKSKNQIGPSYGFNSKNGHLPDWDWLTEDKYSKNF